MSFYRSPVKIIKEVIEIHSIFLWYGSKDKKCINWVSWNNTCRPNAEGGLGIKHIGFFNKALLCKWKWRILNEEGTLWKQILVARYGDVNRGVLLGFETKTNKKASTWWKNLISISSHKTNLFECFAGNINCGLGKDDSILFWFNR